jgi:hypothetical protein
LAGSHRLAGRVSPDTCSLLHGTLFDCHGAQ